MTSYKSAISRIFYKNEQQLCGSFLIEIRIITLSYRVLQMYHIKYFTFVVGDD